MKSHRNVRVVLASLIGVVLLAAGGWVASRQIKSPAQIAADTAAPQPSLISVPVERRSLATEVIVRGTVRYGKPQAIALPSSGLKSSTQVVSRIPKPDSKLREGTVALMISDRPVFALQGETPMHRDLGPGDSGEDVRQLERALARLGYDPGATDGRYDGATAAAVAHLYRSRDAAPFGLTEGQTDKLNAAAAAVETAIDHLLQMRLALRTARRGATPAEINQARLDAAAVAEIIPPVRAALGTARIRAAEARDQASIAKRQQRNGDPTARRDVATAQVDVTSKQNALNEAIGLRDDAQRALDALAPDATPTERETARANLRAATAKIASASSDLAAAQQAYRAAESGLTATSEKARDDARKAARDLAAAESDAREAGHTLAALEHKRRLALARVSILRSPADTRIESEVVAASARQLQRVRAESARLAARSGVQVPADEILFFPTTPVRVDAVSAKRGSQVSGDLMTVSNTRLAIDSSLSPQEKSLVRAGDRVRIEEQDLRIDIKGRVRQVARKVGTDPSFDAGRTYFEVTPLNAPRALVGSSVKLSIAVESTNGTVLAVPVSALSVGADGRERVQVDRGGGQTRLVYVYPGLRAQGLVEVRSRRPGALKQGDLVVVGTGTSPAAKGPTGSAAAQTPAGVSTTPSAASSTAGSGSVSGAGAPSTTATTPGVTSTTPAAPPAGSSEPGGAPAAGGSTTGSQGGFRGP